jgi:hypothetical protein
MRLLVAGNNPRRPNAGWIGQGTYVQLVPGLADRGLVKIVKTYAPNETVATWKTYDVKPTRKLFDLVAAADAEAAAYQDTLQVGLFGARRNRGRNPWTRKLRPGSEIQSVIFDADAFTARAARSWLAAHDFAAPAVDRRASTLRFRQHPPDAFDPASFRTIRLRPGVQAVVGLPR